MVPTVTDKFLSIFMIEDEDLLSENIVITHLGRIVVSLKRVMQGAMRQDGLWVSIIVIKQYCSQVSEDPKIS